MNAQHSPGTPASNTRYRARRALHLLVLGLSATGLQAAAQEQTEAVWKEQEISFQYRSFNAIYSCSSLQQRVVSILRAVGARDDLEVTLQDCDGHFMSDFMSDDPMDARRADPSDTWRSPSSRSWNDPTWGSRTDRFNRRSRREQSVQVRARVKTPTEATPEALAQAKKEKSRRELIARVSGNPAPLLESADPFPAQRMQVTLSRKTIGIEPEECQLLEQMSDSVFRKLDVDIVSRSMSCDPRSPSRIHPKLTVEALVPLAVGATALPQIPAAGQGESTRDGSGGSGSSQAPQQTRESETPSDPE